MHGGDFVEVAGADEALVRVGVEALLVGGELGCLDLG